MTSIIIAISGSRTITDEDYIYSALDEEAAYYLSQGFSPHFHLGDARGVDAIALKWAREREFPRTICFADRKSYEFWEKSRHMREECPPDMEFGILAADWDVDGKDAGPIRNHVMIAGCNDDRGKVPKSELLIVIWDGESRGTRNARATARNAKVFCHTRIYPLTEASDLNEPTA